MPISYDGALNPLSYVINGSECTLTWTQGRRLASISGEEGTDYTYTYNDEGIRTGKTVNGVEHIYHLSGTQILSEEWTENGVQHLIVYSYDASGSPISMTYRKSTDAATAAEVYFLASNPQGDITYIYDIDGNRVVTYNYDAWGNILSITGTKATTIGRYNPFRYRSYYYDNETGFYYLNSRYYDPSSGRFLNADGYVTANGDILGFNMFAYCGNNPVMGYDPTGYVSWWGVLAGVVLTVAGVALAVASGGIGSPIGAALIFEGAALIATTGVATTVCAIEESAMVIDISASFDGRKVGNSLVIDFEDETFDLYAHDGFTASMPDGSPLTYSVGRVFNYDNIGDYGGEFVNVGGSCRWLGFDYCRSPDLDPNSTSARSITFGLPGTQKINGYVGWDYYYQIGSWGAIK